MLQQLLDTARLTNCSDLHLCETRVPYVRALGQLHKMEFSVLTKQDIHDIVSKICTQKQQDDFYKGIDVDGAYSDQKAFRYRFNLYHQSEHIAIAIRYLSNVMPRVDDLKLPQLFKDLVTQKSGIILVTGPTGSGKSTTLAAMINHINETQHRHIITLEDPIEYIHSTRESLINQRELGRDVRSFQEGLKSALREDPDVILVGEMRDTESIALALTAAETGHLVLSTLHTSSAASTVTRIIDVFEPYQQAQVRTQLASCLKAVISQSLLPAADQSSRIPAFEILLNNDAIANMIRENKVVQINSVLQTRANDGMRTLEFSLTQLVNEGLITQEVALKNAADPTLLRRLLKII